MSGAVYDLNTINDVVNESVFVVADEADLMAFVFGPDAVVVGDATSVTVQAVNQGPAPARDVTLDVTVPQGLTFQGSFGPCAEVEPALVRCTFGTVQPFTSGSATLVLLATESTGRVEISATVSAAQPDPVPGGETATWPVWIAPVGAVDLVVVVGQVQLVVGQSDALPVTLANLSPGGLVATDVHVTATYPEELRIDAVTTPYDIADCTVDGQTIDCVFPSVVFQGTILVAVTPISPVTGAAGRRHGLVLGRRLQPREQRVRGHDRHPLRRGGRRARRRW